MQTMIEAKEVSRRQKPGVIMIWLAVRLLLHFP
jgi:hypothetical protein